jgi:1-acyl-sn-glycerol-3-phosphate acyltransferase
VVLFFVSRSYRALVFAVRVLLGTFFRRIEVSGLENVPESSGGLIVAWHPNALVDPALIFTSCPAQVVFGARHGLFAWPVIGRIMRAIGAVPIYRAQDLPRGASDESRREANQKSLDALAKAVANGAFTALFPEGLSHDDSSPRALKTGAARIYYQSLAETPADKPPPVLLPVGLHYDEKRLLGSNVLIVYHPPLLLDGELARPPDPSATEDSRRAHYRALTEKIEQSLKNIVHATENWEIHQLLHRGRKLVRAERAARAGATLPESTMAETVLGFRRLWTGYNELKQSHPDELRQILRRIKRYDRELTALAIDDHELDAGAETGSGWADVRLAMQSLFVFVILPPVLLLGFLVSLPPAALVWLIAKRRSKAAKDEATIKLLTGVVAFPLAWLAVALLVVFGIGGFGSEVTASLGSNWLTGGITFLLCAFGGLLTLHYRRLAAGTRRELRLRMTHADQAVAMKTLLAKRSAICDEVLALAAGLDLPGIVLADGRVLDDSQL